jgi:predicted HAD superfamily Cof-like phosphohydrolase
MDAAEMVLEFHRAAGAYVSDEPTLDVSAEVRDLRLRLITEELDELRVALESDDLAGVADALADLLYVVHGAALAFGIPIAEVFAEVHRANLAKLAPSAGPVEREDGKVLKPDGWKAPNIERVLLAHQKPSSPRGRS